MKELTLYDGTELLIADTRGQINAESYVAKNGGNKVVEKETTEIVEDTSEQGTLSKIGDVLKVPFTKGIGDAITSPFKIENFWQKLFSPLSVTLIALVFLIFAFLSSQKVRDTAKTIITKKVASK